MKGSDKEEKFTSVKVDPEESPDSKDWQDGSDFLPPGWLHRTARGVHADYTKILAPGGIVFNNKVKALNFMIENNFTEHDISRMRQSFVQDGWFESSLLPEHWKYRKCKTDRNEYQFIAPSGEIFNSRRGLLEHFKSSPNITDEDVENAQTLFDEIKATWVNNLQNYEKDDKTVPPGWKIKYFSGVKANLESRDRYFYTKLCKYRCCCYMALILIH